MSDYAMTSLLTRKHLPLLVILSFLWVRPAFSATEFNTDVLDIGERSKVDLSRFSDADYVMPGAYLLDIKINQKTLPQRSIQYFRRRITKRQRCACRLTQWKNGAERRSGQKVTLWHDNQCADIRGIKGATVSDRIGGGVLAITIPQAWMKYSDPDWTPPEQWDDGIPGLLLDYNLSGQLGKQNHNNNTAQNLSSYGTLGANMGAAPARRLPGQLQSAGRRSQHRFRLEPDLRLSRAADAGRQADAGRDLPRLRGVRRLSLHRPQRPATSACCRPTCRATRRKCAASPRATPRSPSRRKAARCTKPPCPPGRSPFRISTARCAVSWTSRWKSKTAPSRPSVDTATIPYLTRPGYVRYNVALGKTSAYDHRTRGRCFPPAISPGLSNARSLYGGALLGGDYNARRSASAAI